MVDSDLMLPVQLVFLSLCFSVFAVCSQNGGTAALVRFYFKLLGRYSSHLDFTVQTQCVTLCNCLKLPFLCRTQNIDCTADCSLRHTKIF